MTIKSVAEVIERYYYGGRVKATTQGLTQRDFLQFSKMAWANGMRTIFYANRKAGQGDEYYFFSEDLATKRFKLSEPNIVGMRRADITDDIIRLPKNSDITNVYPVCEGRAEGTELVLTQVQPGEEVFYLSSEFEDFTFYVVKGKGINTYHLPPCVTNVDVERIYLSDEVDISPDMAFDIVNQVLGLSLKVKGFPVSPTDNSYTSQAQEIKNALTDGK